MVHFRLPVVDRLVHRYREHRALRREQKELRKELKLLRKEQKTHRHTEQETSSSTKHHRHHQRLSRRSSRRLAGSLLYTAPSTVDSQFGEEQDTSKPQLGFSFSGGGWLMVYMYGVAKALREHGLHHDARFIGTSAGSLAIVGIAADNDFDAMVETTITKYLPRAHWSLKGPFQVREYLIGAITRHTDASKLDKISECCTVVYTSLTAWKARKKSQFRDFEHLLNTLLASCCATPIVGLPFKHDDEWVIDGGFTENQPVFPEFEDEDSGSDEDDSDAQKPKRRELKTVTVSPNIFAGADIQPSRYVPAWWSMYPPSEQNLRWVFDLGYEDGLNWIVREQAVPYADQIEIPTKAAKYDHEWKTIIGQLVGYHWLEDQVLMAINIATKIKWVVFLIQSAVLRLLSFLSESVDTFTLLWFVFASASLVGLVLQDQQMSIEFGLVAASHACVVAMKLGMAWRQVDKLEM